MMMRWGLACLLALILPTLASAQTSSLTVNLPDPAFGGPVSFTAVYPREATRSASLVQPNFTNPQVNLGCYWNGQQLFSDVFLIESEKKNGDGTLTGTSYVKTLSSPEWTGPPADCFAVLYYFSKLGSKCCELQLNVLVQLQFQVIN